MPSKPVPTPPPPSPLSGNPCYCFLLKMAREDEASVPSALEACRAAKRTKAAVQAAAASVSGTGTQHSLAFSRYLSAVSEPGAS